MAEKFDYTKSWLNEEDFPLLGFSRNWENPSDYPTIETDEAQVRRDMQSLHDEVKDYLNDTLIPRVIAEDATVAAWQAQEDAHAEAEAGRVLAEEARVTAEQDRETAEAEREQTIAKVENLTVSSEALEYGEPAAVEVTTDLETGGLNMHFGLPAGKNGLDFLPVIEGDDVPDGVEAWIDPSVESAVLKYKDPETGEVVIVGAPAGPDAEAAVAEHNADPDAHADIRATVSDAASAASAAQAAAESKAPMYSYGTTDLTAGVSPLETGKLYFVYE